MTKPLLASGRDGDDETMTFGVELTFSLKTVSYTHLTLPTRFAV